MGVFLRNLPSFGCFAFGAKTQFVPSASTSYVTGWVYCNKKTDIYIYINSVLLLIKLLSELYYTCSPFFYLKVEFLSSSMVIYHLRDQQTIKKTDPRVLSWGLNWYFISIFFLFEKLKWVWYYFDLLLSLFCEDRFALFCSSILLCENLINIMFCYLSWRIYAAAFTSPFMPKFAKVFFESFRCLFRNF